MRKIMIVDDDDIIRRGLSEGFPWDRHGFELAGVAADGEEALDLMAERPPDIVVSDIKMPFMDGLELTKRVKLEYPRMKVILLTGYEEFEYAKEALRLKAFDYLIKPVMQSQLLDKIRLAAEELEREEAIRRQLQEGLPLIRQKVLRSLVLGTRRTGNADQDVGLLQFPFRGGIFLVMVLVADERYDAEVKERFPEAETLKFCIANIAEELLNGSGVVFEYGSDRQLVLIYNGPETDREAVTDMASGLAESIRDNVRAYLKTTVTIGLGTPQAGMERIAVSYKEALAAAECRHIFDKDKVLRFDVNGLPAAERRAGLNHATVERAMAYVREHYARVELSLLETAQAVHVTPNYLSHLFKKEKDINFSEFLIELRMRKAMELLRTERLKAYEVAELVGYANPQYFSAAFKKYAGCSPTEYANQP